jgi:hypothetical protein
MLKNQKQFEVIRDISTLLGGLSDSESLNIIVFKHESGDLFDWSSSKGEPAGDSKTPAVIKVEKPA